MNLVNKKKITDYLSYTVKNQKYSSDIFCIKIHVKTFHYSSFGMKFFFVIQKIYLVFLAFHNSFKTFTFVKLEL